MSTFILLFLNGRFQTVNEFERNYVNVLTSTTILFVTHGLTLEKSDNFKTDLRNILFWQIITLKIDIVLFFLI